MGPKEREIKRRLRVLEHADKIGNVRMTCRYFGLSRSTFYRWKTKYDKQGESGLGNKSTAAWSFCRENTLRNTQRTTTMKDTRSVPQGCLYHTLLFSYVSRAPILDS